MDDVTLKKVGTWTFEVYHDFNTPEGLRVAWNVQEHMGTRPKQWFGSTTGPLWTAIQDACDAAGIIMPLVPDSDLMKLGGHE